MDYGGLLPALYALPGRGWRYEQTTSKNFNIRP
jgi:hypothetical protein